MIVSEQPPTGPHPTIWPSAQQPDSSNQPDTLMQPQAASVPSSHRRRNILIAAGAALVLLLIGTGIGAAATGKSKPTPAPTVTVTAAAAPAPTTTVTVTATPSATAAAPSVSAAAAPAPSSSTLLTLSGSGIQNSAPFVVNSSSVTAHYSYDCSAFGGSGNFIASLVSGNPSDGTYDSEGIANQLGSGGSQTTTVYPQDVGASYHLEVNSECSWSITLTSG
jgi:hypothetical protein